MVLASKMFVPPAVPMVRVPVFKKFALAIELDAPPSVMLKAPVPVISEAAIKLSWKVIEPVVLAR